MAPAVVLFFSVIFPLDLDYHLRKEVFLSHRKLAGAFIGILGGPIGILLMGTSGALAGSMVDAGGSTAGAALLEIVADKLSAGDVAEELEEAVLLQKEMTRQARYQLRQTRKADLKASLKAKRQEREAELEKNFEEYKANLNL